MAKTIAVADEQNTGIERLKSRPRELKEFLQNVRSEMRKVVSPTRTEVQATTTVVLAVCVAPVASIAATAMVRVALGSDEIGVTPSWATSVPVNVYVHM